jgi:O-antigen ligase
MNQLSHTLLTFLMLVLLIVTPLFMNGHAYMAVPGIELIGALMLIILFWSKTSYRGNITRSQWFFVFVTIIFSVMYLIPIPYDIWKTLPGRQLYVDVAEFISEGSATPDIRSTLSIIPVRTENSILMLIPLFAVFLVTMSLPAQRVKTLSIVFLVVAAFEGALGVIQYVNGSEIFYFGMKAGIDGVGTYTNHAHFAALLEMALPIALGLLLSSFGSSHHGNFRARGSRVMESLFSKVLIFASLSSLIIIGGIFSRSRAGVSLIILGILLSTFIFARHIGKKRSVGVSATLGTITMGVLTSVGLIPILNRFVEKDPIEDGRWDLLASIAPAIKEFLPFGSGPGTFADVFRAFQSLEQRGFVNNAHNDYYELLFEMGIFGLILIVFFLVLYFARWVGLRSESWRKEFRYIQTGAGIGLFLLLLHGAVDFNFHVPANMLFFAFLCGIFFHRQKAT